jgi:hypothetical protein
MVSSPGDKTQLVYLYRVEGFVREVRQDSQIYLEFSPVLADFWALKSKQATTDLGQNRSAFILQPENWEPSSSL